MESLSNLFFLLLSPTQDIISDVFFLKRQVWNCIGHSYDGAHSTAHLSLLQYEDPHNESQLYTISERISSVKSFNVRIKNFGFFKNNGTIFLEPVNKLEICELHEKLAGGSIYPHITIARNLNPKDFDLAWKALKDLSYSNSFTCDCVTVLKWMGRKWQSHINLPLAQ
jgi:2'-5' RNA ligase